MQDISHIFRSYDIRGIYGKDLDEEIMRRIGNAFGQTTKTETVVVARDMRLSSKSLRDAFIAGLTSSGKDVVDVGLLPLGVGMFHAWQHKMEFAYITASHLPKEWNGVKFFHANGIGYLEHENYEIRDVFNKGEVSHMKGAAAEGNPQEIISDYISYVTSKIRLKGKIKAVLDCGNGMASLAAPELFRKAGAEAEVIYGDLDGSFPNRNPEPAEDELTELRKKAGEADLGIAYDGDGDRMLLVDEKGRKITPEQTAYLLLTYALNKENGPVVANVECTMVVDKIAAKLGKKLIRFPVGHPYLVDCARKNKACFGMEFTGHYVVPSIFPFDDSLAISLLATQALTESKKSLSEIADEIKMLPFKRINFECGDAEKFKVIDNLKTKLSQQYNNVNTMDGVRIDFPYGWILIRASNTGPTIRLTMEADSDERLRSMEKEFSHILKEEIKNSGYLM
ncbi:MAG: phosphomannomutase/phosphoglucomutase [Candidatus Aenigmarchaeota archaeon]|nr:phosphomannomutase/phosphoglucomutase [Candidatus Aenigmarchaeota archaeon]